MEINDLQERMDDIRLQDADETLKMIMAKVGQMATGELQFGGEEEDEIRRDLVAGTIFACFDYAAQHDLDIEKALEERMEMMREHTERQEEIQDAMESGDAEALAEALDSDQQEVPTGDGSSDRGVY